jgi:hypothetical protein
MKVTAKYIFYVIFSMFATLTSFLFLTQIIDSIVGDSRLLSDAIHNDFIVIIKFIISLVGLIYLIMTIGDMIKELKKHTHVLVESRQHKLKVGTAKHKSFFVQQYIKPGYLIVYIRSLDGWAKPTKDSTAIDDAYKTCSNSAFSGNAIFDALYKKSKEKKLTLYIFDNDDYVELLRKNGAIVKTIDNTMIAFNFSIIEHMQTFGESKFSVLLRDREDNIDSTEINTIEELGDSLITKFIRHIIENYEKR